MNLKATLREWLGEQWGKMLLLFLMLAVIPFGSLAGGLVVFGAVTFVILLGPFFAYIVVRHYRETSTGQIIIESLRSTWRGLITLVRWTGVAAVVAFGIYAAYHEWYPHTVATLVYTNGNWMQGEKRKCFLAPGTQLYHLDCTIKPTDDEPHQFDVTYTGAEPSEQDKTRLHSWMCTRGASTISCYDPDH
jgi:hypothetical protein